jgi:hypothetical protein
LLFSKEERIKERFKPKKPMRAPRVEAQPPGPLQVTFYLPSALKQQCDCLQDRCRVLSLKHLFYFTYIFSFVGAV